MGAAATMAGWAAVAVALGAGDMARLLMICLGEIDVFDEIGHFCREAQKSRGQLPRNVAVKQIENEQALSKALRPVGLRSSPSDDAGRGARRFKKVLQ